MTDGQENTERENAAADYERAGHENAGWKRLFDTDGLTFGTGFPLTGVDESHPAVE